GGACSGGSCICVPNTTDSAGNLECRNQCTSASNCATGYTCSSGSCGATGNVGDRCEVSGYCKSCGDCILDSSGQIAFCRACCGGAAGAGACDSTTCTSTTCASGFSCIGVNNSADKVCTPAGVGVCGACNSTPDCNTGLACAGGL